MRWALLLLTAMLAIVSCSGDSAGPENRGSVTLDIKLDQSPAISAVDDSAFWGHKPPNFQFPNSSQILVLYLTATQVPAALSGPVTVSLATAGPAFDGNIIPARYQVIGAHSSGSVYIFYNNSTTVWEPDTGSVTITSIDEEVVRGHLEVLFQPFSSAPGVASQVTVQGEFVALRVPDAALP